MCEVVPQDVVPAGVIARTWAAQRMQTSFIERSVAQRAGTNTRKDVHQKSSLQLNIELIKTEGDSHWGAWSSIGDKLNFHQPERFGRLVFGPLAER